MILKQKFHDWLRAQGAEVLAPTNPYEFARFRARGGVHVVYQGRRGLNCISFARECLLAFEDGKSIRMGEVQKPRDNMARIKVALRERDGDNCFYCGDSMFWNQSVSETDLNMSEKTDATLEHLVARAKGGPDHMDNLVLVHEECNKKVSNLPLIEKIKIREKRLCSGAV